jgi:hypothetical protein
MCLGVPHHLLKAALWIFVGRLLGIAATKAYTGAPFDHVERPALTVTLCPHFGLTDNLWLTTVLRGAKGAAVSKGLVERSCHHMLQNTAILWVKAHRVRFEA